MAEEENWYSLYATRDFNTVAGTETVAVAADFGRNLNLVDTTSNRVLIEDSIKVLDFADRGLSIQGTVTHFTVIGTNYHFFKVPAAVLAMRDRYWKKVTALTANANTSVLPYFCDNLLIYRAWYGVLQYLNKFSQADRIRADYDDLLKKAKRINRKRLDKMDVFRDVSYQQTNVFPQLPAKYG